MFAAGAQPSSDRIAPEMRREISRSCRCLRAREAIEHQSAHQLGMPRRRLVDLLPTQVGEDRQREAAIGRDQAGGASTPWTPAASPRATTARASCSHSPTGRSCAGSCRERQQVRTARRTRSASAAHRAAAAHRGRPAATRAPSPAPAHVSSSSRVNSAGTPGRVMPDTVAALAALDLLRKLIRR